MHLVVYDTAKGGPLWLNYEEDYQLEPVEQTAFGERRYELTNHLGNVMAVFGEDVRRVAGLDPRGAAEEYCLPEVLRQVDYLPFGLSYRRGDFGDGAGLYRYALMGRRLTRRGSGAAKRVLTLERGRMTQ